MARFASIINSLINGEISPKHYGRTDLGQTYLNSAARLKNFVPNSTGGVVRRKGTRYIKDATSTFSSSNNFRMFELGSTTEVGTAYMFQEGTTVTSGFSKPAKGDNITDTSLGLGSAFTFSVPDYRTSGATTESSAYTTLFSALATPISSAPYTAALQRNFASNCVFFAADGGNTEDLIHEVQTLTIGDTTVFVHKDHAPTFITRTGTATALVRSFREVAAVGDDFKDSDFLGALEEWAAQWCLGVPFRDKVVTRIAQPQMSLSGTLTIGGTVTVTITNPDSWGGFQEGHIGALFISTLNSDTGAVCITDVTNTTTATGIVVRRFNGTTATSNWQEQAWSNVRGWPRSVTYFAGRLFYGGNDAEPNRVWASQAFDIGQMTRNLTYVDQGDSGGANVSAAATDPFSIDISSDTVSEINWMENNDSNIFIGTKTREYIATIETASSSTTLNVRPQTRYGSVYRPAYAVNNSIVFLGTGYQLRELSFNFNDDNFIAEDLGKFADHLLLESGIDAPGGINSAGQYIFEAEVREFILGYNSQGTPMLILRTVNGGLYGCVRDKSAGVASWFRIEIAGTKQNYGVRSIAYSSDYRVVNPIKLVVNREINSADKQYAEDLGVEEFEAPNVYVLTNTNTSGRRRFNEYLDSYKTATPSSTASITGLSHLEGETVRVLGETDSGNPNYTDFGTYTVSSGAITLNKAANNHVIVGLDYNADIVTVPLEAGSTLGTSQGVIKRIEEVGIRFYRSIGCKVALAKLAFTDISNSDLGVDAGVYEYTNAHDWDTMSFVPGSLPLDNQLPLFTGVQVKKLDASYDMEGQLIIRCDQPYPAIIGSIIMKGTTYER